MFWWIANMEYKNEFNEMSKFLIVFALFTGLDVGFSISTDEGYWLSVGFWSQGLGCLLFWLTCKTQKKDKNN